MSGLELLAALRPMTPRLPAIVVTADVLGLNHALASPGPGKTGQGKTGAAESGAVKPDATLVKPVRADLLLDTASTLVARMGRVR
jgi:CheY-like chemotaxis protein